MKRLLPLRSATACAALLLFGWHPASAEVLMLSPVADTYLRSDQPTLPQGENALILVGDTEIPGSALRGLIAFDLNLVPLAGATIRSVSLTLAVESADPASGDAAEPLSVHALSESFAETTATWRERASGAAWTLPGGKFGPALGGVSLNPAKVKAGEVAAFSGDGLTAAVKGAVGGSLNLLVKVDVENATRGVFRFFSRTSARLSPRLVIDYVPPAGLSGVTPIPGHAERPFSPRYQLIAGAREVEVRAERFGFDVAMFDLPKEGAPVHVQLPPGAGAFSLKPARLGIVVTRSGDGLDFTLREPANLVLQVEGLAPLAIHATPPEKDVPASTDANVLYFAPGVTTAGVIRPVSGQTIYLAPGALVKGRVEAKGVSNVTIRGRGILETSGWSKREEKNCGILFENASGIRLEGFGLRSHYTWWQTLFLNSRDIVVSRMNIFGLGVNTDGVDIDGVKDFLVEDSFIRAEDDGLGWHSLDAETNGEAVTERARANNIVIWNTGAGNGIRIGASMETQLWRDIVIENTDILMHAGAGIYSDFSDWAWCEDLVFRDIVIDKPTNPLVFKILKTHYSNATGFLDERGHYERLVFEQITMAGGVIKLQGFDADHRIDQVYFNGCVNAGALVDGLEDITVNAFVTHVRFNETVPARPAIAAGRHEAESQESATNKKPQITYADARLSGGKGRVLRATAAGDHVDYTIHAPTAGVYRVTAGVGRTPASGRYQLAVNGAPLGREQDLYSATDTVGTLDLGTVTIQRAGAQSFRFAAVGKNQASAGYQFDLDYVQLAPAR